MFVPRPAASRRPENTCSWRVQERGERPKGAPRSDVLFPLGATEGKPAEPAEAGFLWPGKEPASSGQKPAPFWPKKEPA